MPLWLFSDDVSHWIAFVSKSNSLPKFPSKAIWFGEPFSCIQGGPQETDGLKKSSLLFLYIDNFICTEMKVLPFKRKTCQFYLFTKNTSPKWELLSRTQISSLSKYLLPLFPIIVHWLIKFGFLIGAFNSSRVPGFSLYKFALRWPLWKKSHMDRLG